MPGETGFKAMAGRHVPVPVGAQAIVRTGGGGGWGDPLERDPEIVRRDVIEELVSAEAARRDYGVVLDHAGQVDTSATRVARASIEGQRKPGA